MNWKAGRRVINRLRKKYGRKNGVVSVGVLDTLSHRYATSQKYKELKQ